MSALADVAPRSDDEPAVIGTSLTARSHPDQAIDDNLLDDDDWTWWQRVLDRLDQRRLLRTSAFRMALVYATLFSALSAATLGFIYWSTVDQIESQVDARLRLESDYLIKLYTSGRVQEVIELMRRSKRDGTYGETDTYSRFYTLKSDDTTTASVDQEGEELPIRLKSKRLHVTRDMGEIADLPPGDKRAFNPVRVAETQLSNGTVLIIGHEITNDQAILDHTFVLVAGATVLTVLFSLFGGLWIGTTVLRRIDSVSRTASEIMSGDLSQRLSVTTRDDEFDEIATKLNQMLGRIEHLMKSMQQVTNNVAHDLRSPLTRLRNRLEVTLLEARDTENYRTVMEEAIGDADSLIHTFNAMLGVARLEAGIDEVEWSEAPIGNIVAELAELYAAVAEEQEGLTFEVSLDINPIYRCNPHLIAQAVTNLLDNAIKYTSRPGRVNLSLIGNEDRFQIVVADTGPGIPDEEQERVFERFVRLENERNSPGNGLGLSLVKAVTRLHAATLELQNTDPGLRVVVTFSKRRAAEHQRRHESRRRRRAARGRS